MDNEPAPAAKSKLTAFRAVEKKYQLRKARSKQSRRHTGPVASLESVDSVLLEGVLQLQEVTEIDPPASGSARCHMSAERPGQRIWTLSAHPGLAVMPGALSLHEQHRIVSDALGLWPAPPNSTNHSVHVGGLPGLWDAAQTGMKLKSSIIASRRQEDTSTASATQTLLPDPATKQQSSQRVPSLCEVPPSSPIDSRALSSLELKLSQDSILSVPSTPGVKAAEPAISQALPGNDTFGGGEGAGSGLGVHKRDSPEDEGGRTQRDESRSPCSAPDSVPSPTWCQSGEGPPARQLLRKLRWATLGPAYDWTRREYSSAAISPVLPAYLRELAIRLAAAASGALGEARVVSSSAESGGNMGLDGLEGSWRPFEPNAALVNYYQSDSDTLCGHKDDAEGALDQPLVSLSIGCDAIFLIGGVDRDVAPTALLLRSGDVLVMAGEARRCYHGVPRVLLGSSAPGFGATMHGLAETATNSGAKVDSAVHVQPAMLAHIANARLNISLRQVLTSHV